VKVALVLSLLLLASCVYAIPDYKWRSHGGKAYSAKPEVFLHLGGAPQVCANRAGFAEVVVFVNLYNLPPQEVRFLFNEKVEVRMVGKDLTLTLHKVRVGEHFVVVNTSGYHDVRLSFSVWDCGA
jgi:hypothetical protein